MNKFLLISTFVLVFLGSVSATQPKILELEDNLGNTYTFNPEEGIAQADYGEEFVVKNDAQITLCATKVRKEQNEEVKFSYSSNLNVQHPQNVDDNCFTWNISQSDYKDSWWLDVQISNKDDISYADYKDIDHIARLTFDNLAPPNSRKASDEQTKTYNNIMVSKSKYEEMKLSKEKLNNTLKQKNERIQELQETVSQLRNRISELESKVNKLNTSETDSKTAAKSQEQGKSSGDTSEKGKKKGIVDGLLGIFG